MGSVTDTIDAYLADVEEQMHEAGRGDQAEAVVAAIREQIWDTLGDEPTVLYCGSSNRVGALLALKAYWLDGADPEDALELGRAAGMTRLEGRVTELMSEGR